MLVLSPLRSAFQEAQRFAAPPISHRPGEWDAAALRRLVKASLGGAQIIVVSNRQAVDDLRQPRPVAHLLVARPRDVPQTHHVGACSGDPATGADAVGCA